jgi:hypothetical protein
MLAILLAILCDALLEYIRGDSILDDLIISIPFKSDDLSSEFSVLIVITFWIELEIAPFIKVEAVFFLSLIIEEDRSTDYTLTPVLSALA